MRSIGILGGSYNPPHLGHLNAAIHAQSKLGLDEVWLWVSRNIFKDEAEYAPLEARMTACSLIANGRKGLIPTGIEADFSDTMTATTMTMLGAMYPQTRFVWIFGEDNFAGFHTWKREKFKVGGKIVPDWQYLMHNFPIAVMQRPGYAQAALDSPAAAYGRSLHIEDPSALTASGRGWTVINNPSLSHSSTEIKKALREGQRDLLHLGLPRSVEDYIYDRGLFGVPGGAEAAQSFNIAGKPRPHNTVRFEAFLTLAHAVNLCKSVIASTGSITQESLVRYAGTTWDRAESKGDLGKSADVPGEIADSLISLYWLAAPLRITAPDAGGQENRRSVVQWCDQHYPGQSLARRLECMIEEAVELCAVENMEKSRMMHVIAEIFAAPDCDTIQGSGEKLFTALQDYAQIAGGNLGTMLDAKMQTGRARTVQASATREAAKLGWKGPL